MRIAVIEDDPNILRHYVNALVDLGVEHHLMENKPKALDYLRKYHYDGAIVDLQLSDDPGHHEGIDVLEYISKCDEGTVPFVVSGTPEPRDVNRSWKHGALDVVLKSDEDYYSIIDRLVQKCKDNNVARKVDITRVIAYLAAPELTPYWESSVFPVLGVGFERGKGAIVETVGEFTPLLRQKSISLSFKTDRENKCVFGKFWSKAYGAAVHISLHGANGRHSVVMPDSSTPVFERTLFREIKVSAWASGDPDRDLFAEFAHDKPWVNN